VLSLWVEPYTNDADWLSISVTYSFSYLLAYLLTLSFVFLLKQWVSWWFYCFSSAKEYSTRIYWATERHGMLFDTHQWHLDRSTISCNKYKHENKSKLWIYLNCCLCILAWIQIINWLGDIDITIILSRSSVMLMYSLLYYIQLSVLKLRIENHLNYCDNVNI